MTTSRIERILCPTDFSTFSSQALRHALALARTFHARLKVVHVIPHRFLEGESIYASAPWLLTPEGRQNAEQEMRRFLEPAREARIDHEVEVREGDPWREVLAAVEDMRADLVVLGTHGHGGLDRLFLGSVAEKLIRRLPCPVMSVCREEGRTWAAPGLVTRILCATDFSETSAEAFRLAVALAEKHKAEVTLLYVVENLPDLGDTAYGALVDIEALRQRLERQAGDRLRKTIEDTDAKGVRIEPRAGAGRAYKEILRVAAEERADLIVIGARGHGVIGHMVSGSNAQHVIRGATCPVLVARALRVERPSGGPTGLALATPGAQTS